MKLYYKNLLLLLLPVFLHYSATAQNNVKAFASIGSSGIGLGLKYKNVTLYTRYNYEYKEDASVGMIHYTHSPSIGVTYNILKEQQAKLYVGLDYRMMYYTEKYLSRGSVSQHNFFVSVPLGVELKPFKSIQNLSVVLETGLELEHYWWDNKGYSWNLNLWRGIIEIRYQFGKRIRI